MITSISFKNFKSYREVTLPLAPLALLIGANASGKSNAIEGMRFLSWLAEGRRQSQRLPPHAIDWLKRARAAYRAMERQAEWSAYREQLLATHGRKYKLVGMLKQRGLA